MSRILWNVCSQPGSLFPAVPIATELRRRGHQVVVHCEAASEEMFHGMGFDFRPTPMLDHHVSTGVRPVDARGRREWHAQGVQALFTDAVTELAAGRYDAALVDPLETGAGFAAEAAGVPWASYAHFAMHETGHDVPFMYHVWDPTRRPEQMFAEWWSGLRARVGLGADPRPAAEQRWWRHSPLLALLLGLPDLVHPRGELPPYVRRVGPSLWEPPHDGVPSWVRSLGAERPAVLASVSTARQQDVDLVGAVAEALADAPVDVVATIPTGDAPPLPANVKVCGFVPHGALLERVRVVACHAGYGTVTRAACAGVPMLLFPHGRDQFDVARGAVHAGVAVSFEPDRWSVADVRTALLDLLREGSHRRRAGALAGSARGWRAASTAADLVEQLTVASGPFRGGAAGPVNGGDARIVR